MHIMRYMCRCLSSEKISIDLDGCLGCGLCASNCPEEAISLEKVRNHIPRQSMGNIFG